MLKSDNDLELVVVDKDIEELTDNEKSSASGSAKKLRQSRLSFKMFASNVENSSSLKIHKKQIASTDDKCITELTIKRRLSETSESDRNDTEAALTKSNKSPIDVSKKQKTTSISDSVLTAINAANEVVVISSSSSDTNDNSPVRAATPPKISGDIDAGTSIFCKPLSLNSNDRKMLKNNLKANLNRNVGNKKKRRRASALSSSSSSSSSAAFAIKLGKMHNSQLIALAKAARRNKEIECISESELNPQKRSKIDDDHEISLTISKQDDDAINSTDDEKENERKDNPATAAAAAAAAASLSISKAIVTESELELELELETSDKCDESSTAVTCNSRESSGSVEYINEIQTPADNQNRSESNQILPQLKKKSKGKLSQKQKVLLQQRHAAREEKERKLEEQKMQRQLEKKNKEMLRKKEREAKEQKRLADLEFRNEEKRKKNEAKVEELRKKEDERRRKEIEKEEAELKKKKAAEVFTKFFVTTKVAASASASANGRGSSVTNIATADVSLEQGLAFQPFEIKGDMQLAPVLRKTFTEEAHARLDECLTSSIEITNASYLSDLQSGKITPCKWKRPPSNEGKVDYTAIENELDEAGVVIIEDTTIAGEQRMRAKFYKFHDNRRPPYYGTWSKSSAVIKPRRPFAQDKEYFDYDIDSDDDWEEDEPGESLEGSDNDKESEDDDYEVDNEWFVPHGHLSEEEIQNKDEFASNENTPEVQKLKLQLLQQEFANEMKKKTEKIIPRLIGCIWVDENGNPPSDCYKLILEALQSHAIICSSPINFDTIDIIQKSDGNKLMKTVVLSDDLIYKLITLVHGNKNSKKFLLKEFSAYMKQIKHDLYDENSIGFLLTAIRRKFDEIATWQVLVDDNDEQNQNQNQNQEHKSKTQMLLPALTPTTSNITLKKKKFKKKLCWIVQQHILDKFGLTDLSTKNTWNYILQTKQNTLPLSTNSSKDINHDSLEVIDSNSKIPTVDKIKGFKSIAAVFKKLPFNNLE